MILAIIVFVISVIGTIIYARLTYDDYKTGDTKIPKFKDSCLANVPCWFLSLLVGVVICMFTTMILYFVTEALVQNDKVETETIEISSNEIYALQDNQFISRQYSGNSIYYFTLEEFEGKGKTTQKYSSYNSYINYIPENQQPYVKKVKLTIKDTSWYLLPVSLDEEYYFYIPEGSIVEEYNIDLQ